MNPNPTDPFLFDADWRGDPRAALTFAKAWELAHKLEANAGVVWAEPSFATPVPGEFENVSMMRRRASSGGNQPDHLPGTQRREWSLKLCNVRPAWKFSREQTGKKPGQDVLIGHPDSGYLPHTQLDQDRLRTDIDFDFLDEDTETRSDTGSHGLATGSVIMSGSQRVGDFVTGTAPFADLLPLRVTQPGRRVPAPVLIAGGMARLSRAIDHAVNKGCAVISISLGGFPSRMVERSVERARRNGGDCHCGSGE